MEKVDLLGFHIASKLEPIDSESKKIKNYKENSHQIL